MFNVFCPYGNSMSNNYLNMFMVCLATIGLFMFSWVVYQMVRDGWKNRKRMIIGVLLGIFTLITFLLNLAMSNQWIIIGD